MRIVLHRAIPDDEVLRRQWNALVQEMEQPEVFYTYEWASAVSRAYHPQIVPLLLLAYEGDSLVALVALATNRSAETFFLSSTTADYCDFICHPRIRAEFLDAVFAELKQLRAGMLRLANLPVDSATSPALLGVTRRHGYSMFSRPAYACAQVVIDSPEKREAVRESAKRRIRRYAKTMGNQYPARLSHCKSADDIAAALPAFAKAHVARFLATGRVSSLVRPERRVFLEELTSLLAPSGWAALSQLMIGEQLAAWNYGFQFAGSWFWYQPTFATDFERYSPGLWLLSKIVEESCETEKLKRIDLGLGAEGYKERLANARRQTLHVTVATSSLRCWTERIRYHSAAAMQSVPQMETWTRAGMRYAASLKTTLSRNGFLDCLRSVARRCQRLLSEQAEFFFLQFSRGEVSRRPHPVTHSAGIRPVDLNLLATAAMQYEKDPETLAYLLQAAERLGTNQSQGFALVSGEGVPLHFCWVTDFKRFSSEKLRHLIKPASSGCALIVDCWTPVSVRGRGHYCETIALVAAHLEAAGKLPWIFTSASHAAALRGAETAGFVRVFSMLHKRVLFRSKAIESPCSTAARLGVEVSPAA